MNEKSIYSIKLYTSSYVYRLAQIDSPEFVREGCKNKKVKKSGPGTTSPLTPPSLEWSGPPILFFWKQFFMMYKSKKLKQKLGMPVGDHFIIFYTVFHNIFAPFL